MQGSPRAGARDTNTGLGARSLTRPSLPDPPFALGMAGLCILVLKEFLEHPLICGNDSLTVVLKRNEITLAVLPASSTQLGGQFGRCSVFGGGGSLSQFGRFAMPLIGSES